MARIGWTSRPQRMTEGRITKKIFKNREDLRRLKKRWLDKPEDNFRRSWVETSDGRTEDNGDLL